LRGLSKLSQLGIPVLLIMDDPFFANSGWDLLLEKLGQTKYSGIAVLGASPTYLYETYARRIPGGRIAFKKFRLGATSRHERSTLARMYGKTESSFTGNHEELLVFAMETVTGNSFDKIISRIWSTLNDGLPISNSGTRDVQWPVLAFLLTSYLHRYNVMCPEPLLRAWLVNL